MHLERGWQNTHAGDLEAEDLFSQLQFMNPLNFLNLLLTSFHTGKTRDQTAWYIQLRAAFARGT